MKLKEDNPKRIAQHQRAALNEIELLRQLSHPNVIKLKGVCTENGHLHALTELMDGGCLETLATDCNRDLTWSIRLHLALDIARAMKYIHNKGYIHRDLTASNVLLKLTNSRQGLRAVVADFGLATKLPKKEIKLPVVGSPFYMSPECLNSKYYDEKTDVFSFGIILIQLILRTDSDPDHIARTTAYGLNYAEVGKKVKETSCPLALLADAFYCCQVDPKERPSFSKLTVDLGRLLNSPNYHEIVADQESLPGIVRSTHLKKIADNIECKKRSNRKLPGGHLFSLTAAVVGSVMSELDAANDYTLLDRSIFELRFQHKKLMPGSASSDEFLWRSTDELDSSITSVSDCETTLRRTHSFPKRKRKDEKEDISELSDDADSGVALGLLKSPTNFKIFNQKSECDFITPNKVWNLAKACEERDKEAQFSSRRRKMGCAMD